MRELAAGVYPLAHYLRFLKLGEGRAVATLMMAVIVLAVVLVVRRLVQGSEVERRWLSGR